MITVEQLLKEEIYSIKEKYAFERQKSLFRAMDRILTGVSPEDFINHLDKLNKSTKNATQKRRYRQDIDFIKSEMKNNTA